MADLGKTLGQLTQAMTDSKEAAKMIDKLTLGTVGNAKKQPRGSRRAKRTSLSLLPANLTLGATNSSAKKRLRAREEKLETPSTYWSIMSYISYIFLVVTGYIR